MWSLLLRDYPAKLVCMYSLSGDILRVSDQVLNILHGHTQQQARVLLQQLGADLLGRGQQLNDTLGSQAIEPMDLRLERVGGRRPHLDDSIEETGLTSGCGCRSARVGRIVALQRGVRAVVDAFSEP